MSTAFLAAEAKVFSADSQLSTTNSEEIGEDFAAAGSDSVGGLFGEPKAATTLLGDLPTDSPLSNGLTQASSVKTGLISVPSKSLLAARSQSLQPVARQLTTAAWPNQPSLYQTSYQAQAAPATTVPATVIPANAQNQPAPAAKPGSVQQNVPPAAATESPKPTDDAEGDNTLTAPGAVPPGVPGTAPETFITPATPNSLPSEAPGLAPAEEPASEADLAPAEELPMPSGDLDPAENRAPEGQISPPLSPLPNEGIIRESNPSMMPVTPGADVPPAGIPPAGISPAGVPINEAEPTTPLPPIPMDPSPMDPSMDEPSVAPSADPSVEPLEPIEPVEPVESLPPVGDSIAPNEFPVSGSSSDRLVGEGFTPFQLSYLALAGGLEEEGIPGGPQLISAYKQGDVSAEDIVTAGAMSKRLGEAASDQEDYTQGVDRFLEIFRKDARSSG